jgi:penicillin-binding protein 1A
VKLAQGIVLNLMVRSGYVSQEEADAALDERLVLARSRSAQYRAPHFVYAVRSEARDLLGNEEALDTAGLEITTTLDWEGYQRFAEKWAAVAYDMDRMSDQRLIRKYGEGALTWIKQLQGRNINNDALVTLNYRTGAVLAYVGSANFYGESTDAHQPAYDVVGQAFRQSGSAFKPITYATGFESGALTPSTMLMDIEGEIVDGYSVPNADQRERGPVRVREALKYSLNIPVAKAQQLIGTENVVAMAERLGLEWDPAQEDEVAVPSLTLGTIGVHQLDLAAAYGAMANGGIFAEPYMIQTIRDRNGEVIYDRAEDAPEPQRAMSAESAYLVTDILADNTDPAENVVWGERFQLTTDEGRRPATLKTGTTNDFRDLQAFGFLAPPEDPEESEGAIVTGVWVGNSDFSRIADVFAADGPTFIWHDYMEEVAAHNELPVRDFPRPDGIVEQEVDELSGMLPGEHTVRTLTEIFAQSHQPDEEDNLHRRLRIEAETGKIWQEGCGDFESQPGTGDDEEPQPRERVYLDLGDYEEHHDTWDAANDRWIERWQGRERQIDRFPVGPLGSPLAPTERCTPGEIPTSTPTPSPSPTPEATPEPTATPEETLLPSVPLPSATPTPEPGG